VSYVRATNTTSVSNLDLKPFMADAVTRNYITNAGYLLGVQAGFEIWQQTASMTTNSFSVAIN
jgi:cellulose 1,4-beta-cellobiosidase